MKTLLILNLKYVQVITLEGDSEGWYFITGDGYLYAAASNYNYLRTETTPDENGNAKATIGISSDGDATIVFQGKNTRNNLRFNNNNILSLLCVFIRASTCSALQEGSRRNNSYCNNW